jgi:hypothetical protein
LVQDVALLDDCIKRPVIGINARRRPVAIG